MVSFPLGSHFDRKVKKCETSAKITDLIHPESLGPYPPPPNISSFMSGCLPSHPDILPVVEGPARILPRHLGNVHIGWRRFTSPSLQASFPPKPASLPLRLSPSQSFPCHWQVTGIGTVMGSAVPSSRSCLLLRCFSALL